MSVVTAQIIAGTGDLYRPGVRPLNVLWFAEGGGRPSWLLERSGWLDFIEPGRDRGGDGVGPREPVLLVPESPETILEDGLLLLVARGIEDPAVVARSRHLVPELLDSSHVELDSGKHNPDDLVEMRELSAEREMSCQLTVILLQGNMLHDQLPVLENYPFNLEVCSPTFSRQRNPWYPEGKRFGSLQTRPPGPPTE